MNILVLVEDLLALESRQPAKLEIQNRLGLDIAEFEAADDLFEVFYKTRDRLIAGHAAPVRDLADARKIAGQPRFGLIHRPRITDQRE